MEFTGSTVVAKSPTFLLQVVFPLSILPYRLFKSLPITNPNFASTAFQWNIYDIPFVWAISFTLDYIEGLPFDGSLLANNYLFYYIVLKNRVAVSL